jgi:UDP-2,3-diacylglucosamine hydrolase
VTVLATVLGTPLSTLADATPGERLWLLSDLHLGPGTEVVLRKFEALLAAATAAGVRRLCVLGDLFDHWTGPKQMVVEGFAAVIEVLAAATRRGLAVTVIHGNRDFALEQRFAHRSGARVVAGGLVLRSGGRRFVLLHGDETCLNDLPYQES